MQDFLNGYLLKWAHILFLLLEKNAILISGYLLNMYVKCKKISKNPCIAYKKKREHKFSKF